MNNTININQWYGLFGNNLMQLAGSIFYAKCCEGKTSIYLPKNNFFNADSKIEVEKEFDYEVKIPTNLQWTSHNYYNSISNYINFDDYSKFLKKNIISVYKKEIYSILDRSFNFDQYKHLDLDDTLSIHFRSGDAIGQSPHPAYVQSPWSYFEKILKKTNPKKVIICTGFGYQNTNINPCYNKIIEFCSKNNIEVDSRLKSLSEDVYILSHSKKVVIGGVSTFSLTSFSTKATAVGKVLSKSLMGYVLAFVIAMIVWSVASKWMKKVFVGKPSAIWTPLQWVTTGTLWSVWLMQDAANIAVYLPRQLNIIEFLMFLLPVVAGLGWMLYQGGEKIQEIVDEKSGVVDIRAATVIDFVYAIILFYFKMHSKIPMSTTWVFLGLLGGRELAMSLQRTTNFTPKQALQMMGRDGGLALLGLVISFICALLVNDVMFEQFFGSL